MTFAIIAAGEGSRLSQEGIKLPKPLVRICGEPMIDRLIRLFNENGADRICIIVNKLHAQTETHVRKLMARGEGAPIELAVQDTPSSMHSFSVLSPWLEQAPFCLTTVDTIFRETDFAEYIKAFRESNSDSMMGVTDFIDDEKPLYVGTDNNMNITGFYDEPQNCRYISGGLYALKPNALRTLSRCMEAGLSRMRNFQRGLVADGLKLKAYPMSKVLDIDHAQDIIKAETFLRSINKEDKTGQTSLNKLG